MLHNFHICWRRTTTKHASYCHEKVFFSAYPSLTHTSQRYMNFIMNLRKPLNHIVSVLSNADGILK